MDARIEALRRNREERAERAGTVPAAVRMTAEDIGAVLDAPKPEDASLPKGEHAVLKAARELYKPGDLVDYGALASRTGLMRSTAVNYVGNLKARNQWPYRTPPKGHAAGTPVGVRKAKPKPNLACLETPTPAPQPAVESEAALEPDVEDKPSYAAFHGACGSPPTDDGPPEAGAFAILLGILEAFDRLPASVQPRLIAYLNGRNRND